MDISGDYSSSIANLASDVKSSQLGQQISMAVLKQTQDSQEQFAAALIQMINSGPTLQGTGQIINVAA